MSEKDTAKSVTLRISQDQELEILREILHTTNSGLDLSAILKEIVSIVNEVTKADSVLIYLFDSNREYLVLKSSKIPHDQQLDKIYLKVGEGVAGWVAQHQKSVAISKNAYQDQRFKSFEDLPEDKFEAILSLPLYKDEEIVGVINIQHKESHDYADNVKNLMGMIARQVGGVIDNARLYEETKTKALQFDSLIKVSQSITSEHYLDEILDLIVVVTAEMLHSKICSIMLFDPKRNELTIRATQSLSHAYKDKPNIPVDSSLIGEVVQTRKPLSVFDVQKEERYRFRDLAKQEGLTSMLCVPMVFKEQVIGVISVYTKEKHHFSDDEINVLQIIANQSAVSIDHTHMVEEAMKAKEALETRKVIERAKGILMKMSDLDEPTAHKMIHKKSMDSGKTMKQIAESIILMDDFKNM